MKGDVLFRFGGGGNKDNDNNTLHLVSAAECQTLWEDLLSCLVLMTTL